MSAVNTIALSDPNNLLFVPICSEKNPLNIQINLKKLLLFKLLCAW